MPSSDQTAPDQSADRSVGWGILGPGSISRKFAGQLPHSSTGRLVAVGSSDPQRAAEFATEFGASRSGDHQSVLDDPEVDAVYIGTVHTTHAELAVRALRAGKAVLAEKPLTPLHADTMVVLDLAQQLGGTLVEAFMYRFHPQTRRALELLAEGAIGELVHVDAAFAFRTGADSGRLLEPALAGGGILDVGCYPVSIARAAVAAARSGQAFGGIDAGLGEPTRIRARGSLTDTGVDAWSVAQLAFGSDEAVTASLRTGVRVSDSGVTLHGTRGLIRLSDPWTLAEEQSLVLATIDADPVTETFGGQFPYALEADAVAAARESGGQAPQMSWADSLGNARILDSWLEQVGVAHPFAADEAVRTPLAGPLTGGTDVDGRPGVIGRAEIAGLAKPVSRLVLGVDNQTTPAHADAMFDHFFGLGGNAFDTAYIYGGGRCEELLGRWMEQRGVRDQVVTITKGAHTPHCDPESLSRQLLESLERQRTDHADIYLMHRDNPEIPVGEFVDVLAEHAAAGRIGIFGGSNWSLERFAEANAWAAANQKQGFSVLSNHFGLAEALDVPWAGCRHVTDRESKAWLDAHAAEITLLPWSSQARGFFTGRARPDDRSDAELGRCYYSDDNFERLRRAEQLAGEFGVAPTAIALAYVLHQPFGTFPLIGPRTIAETRSSVAGLGVELTPEQVAWLDLRS